MSAHPVRICPLQMIADQQAAAAAAAEQPSSQRSAGPASQHGGSGVSGTPAPPSPARKALLAATKAANLAAQSGTDLSAGSGCAASGSTGDIGVDQGRQPQSTQHGGGCGGGALLVDEAIVSMTQVVNFSFRPRIAKLCIVFISALARSDIEWASAAAPRSSDPSLNTALEFFYLQAAATRPGRRRSGVSEFLQHVATGGMAAFDADGAIPEGKEEEEAASDAGLSDIEVGFEL